MTPLSPHFSLEEMVVTQVRGWDNTPSKDIVTNLKATAINLENIRSLLSCPMIVTSGYRSKRVNELVGGAINSAHMQGYAADFIAPTYGTPLEICQIIAANDILFDQLIEEGTWVHISFDPKMRRQVLTRAGGGYISGLSGGKNV